jgi:hypothetical protein
MMKAESQTSSGESEEPIQFLSQNPQNLTMGSTWKILP